MDAGSNNEIPDPNLNLTLEDYLQENAGDYIQNFMTSEVGILAILFMLLSIIINGTYIFVSQRSERHRDLRYITTALSITNIIVPSSYFFVHAIQLAIPLERVNYTYYNIFMCFATVWQVFLLLGIAVDRYLAILKPLHYPQYVTKSRVAVVTVASAIFGLAFASTALFLPSETIFESILTSEELDLSVTYKSAFHPHILLFYKIYMGLFMLVAVVIFALYLPVINTIVRHLRRKDTRTTWRNYINTLMMLLVQIYFILAYIPYLLLVFVPYIQERPVFSRSFTLYSFFVNMCTYSIHLVTPLMYGMCTPGFWRDFSRTCRKQQRNGAVNIATISP